MNRLLVTLAISIALCTGALAGDRIIAGQLRQPCDNPPPASAQRPYNPLDKVIIHTASPQAISKFCARPSSYLYGCIMQPSPTDRVYVIYLNSLLNAKERACTLIYEKAHLNGWFDPVVEAMSH